MPTTRRSSCKVDCRDLVECTGNLAQAHHNARGITAIGEIIPRDRENADPSVYMLCLCMRWAYYNVGCIKSGGSHCMSFLVELPKDEYNSNAFAGFNPAGGFASGNALAMAWMAQLAYETRLPDKVGAISQLFQLTDLQIVQQSVDNNPLPVSDTRGIVASRGEAIIVAFAGTDPLHLLNWVSDFYIGRPTEDVHEGFQAAADAVWPVVGVAIERSINENRRLFVVGHSLGAAIALVTVDRARQEKNLSSAQVFVFGAPRVGKADFVAAYNPVFGRTTYRLVCCRARFAPDDGAAVGAEEHR
jgi:hypothetical protein